MVCLRSTLLFNLHEPGCDFPYVWRLDVWKWIFPSDCLEIHLQGQG